MKLNIGQNIRQLRRERDITQEEFAGILGVTYQSVSRWENGTCYPDMELLPTVAEFFGTTVDKLLGVDETVERTRVAEYCVKFQEAISRGDVDKCIETAREGVREYPNNYVLLNKLMYALFISGDDDGNIPQWKENMQKYDAEITALGERIMKYCPDQDIRLEATSRLAFNHCEMGRKETGRAIYDTLPSAEYSRENQMWWSLEDDEKLPFLRKKVNEDYGSLRGSIWLLADSRYLSDEQSIAAVKKVFELEKLMYDGEKTPDGWGAAKLQLDIARLYARTGDSANAFEHLRDGAKAAKAFDSKPEVQHFDTLLLGETTVKSIDFETSDNRTLCEIMRDKWLVWGDFDGIRGTDEFKSIVKTLS